TTENPSFEVNSALLSRCQVYTLKPLTEENLMTLVQTALTRDEELSKRAFAIKEYKALLGLSGGDARKLLNLIELIAEAFPTGEIRVTDQMVMDIAQKKVAIYDK